MNVAIAMKNEHELQDDHFGQAPFYRVYELQGKSHIFVEKRSNRSAGLHQMWGVPHDLPESSDPP